MCFYVSCFVFSYVMFKQLHAVSAFWAWPKTFSASLRGSEFFFKCFAILWSACPCPNMFLPVFYLRSIMFMLHLFLLCLICIKYVVSCFVHLLQAYAYNCWYNCNPAIQNPIRANQNRQASPLQTYIYIIIYIYYYIYSPYYNYKNQT